MKIYVVRERPGGHCKVGITRDTKARLKSLQCGNPRRLHLIHSQDVPDQDAYLVEGYAHSLLGAKFERFNEWFKVGWMDAMIAVRTAVEHVVAKPGTGVNDTVTPKEGVSP